MPVPLTRQNQRPSFIALLLGLTWTASLMCCNSDDDGNQNPSIEGILWTQTRAEFTACSDSDSEGVEEIDCTNEQCTTVRYESGTATLTETEKGIATTTEFSYTISGNTISSGGLSATFEIDGDMLIVTNEAVFGCRLIEYWLALD